MKTIFTNVFFLLLALQMQAQIVIEKSDYSLMLNDSIFRIIASNGAEAALPESGENMIWDYTNLMFVASDSSFSLATTEGTNPLYPASNFSYSTNSSNQFGGFRTLTFYGELDDDGLRYYGRLDGPLQIPLGPITGVDTDSLEYLDTEVAYNYVNEAVVLPLEYENTQVESEFLRLGSNILVTATPFGLDHAPGEIVALRRDSSIFNGWGTLQLNSPSTGEEVDLEVLLSHETTYSIDSFYLGGMPAPQSLLDPLGQVQADKDTLHSFNFYAKDFSTPVFRISVSSTGAVSARISTEILDIVSSIPKITKNLTPVTIAPQPSNGDFQLQFFKPNADNWHFEIFNMLGQKVHQQKIGVEQGEINETVSISVPTAGNHVYVLRNEAGTVMGTGKILIQ